MAKQVKKRTTTRAKLSDLEKRVQLFADIASLSMQRTTGEDYERHSGQFMAFTSVLTLIRQIEKRGDIWKGGYIDNIGVVYSDQVQAVYENMKKSHNTQTI